MAVLEVPQGGGFFCLSVIDNPLNMKSKGNTKFFDIWNKLDMWLIFLYRKIMMVMFWRLQDCLLVESHLHRPYVKGRKSIVPCSLLLFSVLTTLGITIYLYHCLKPVCFLPFHRWRDFISLDTRVVHGEGQGFGSGLESSVNYIACSVSVVTCINSSSAWDA